MKKKVKKFVAIKTSFLIAMLVIGISPALSFNVSARFFPVEPIITVTHERPTEYVIPLSGVYNINLSTSFTLTGVGATFVQTSSLLKNSAITIRLDVSTPHDWAEVSITNSPATLKINEPGAKWRSNIQLTVTEKAPAFTLGQINVTATSSRLVGRLFVIEEKTETFYVPFEIGYWGALSIHTPEGTFKFTTPYTITKIPINITNEGNGITYVCFEIVEFPNNWNVKIPSSIIIPGFEGNQVQVFLEVLTNHEFEENTIKIKIAFHMLGRPDLHGQSEIITFTLWNL